MSDRFSFVEVFTILAILVGISFSAVAAQAPLEESTAVVRISPADKTLIAGEEFTVEIWVDDVVDLYGADIQLKFDANAFEVLGDDSNTDGPQITIHYDFLNPAFIIYKYADNSSGIIRYAASQVNPMLPVSGSGVLFEFNFRVKGSFGHYPVTFKKHDLSAIGGEPIANTVLEAVFAIEEPSSIFFPLVKR